MIIDCHTHLGRNEHINARVDELLKSMDRSGVDKSLVFAGDLNAYPTSMMLEEIEPHRDRLYGVAAWDFNYSLSHRDMKLHEQQDYICNLYETGKIVAVKFYVGYYHYMPSQLSNVLWRLNEIGCSAIFHCGDCLNSVRCAKLKYAHPLNIDDVAVDYPAMNFIIAHMGFTWVKDAAEVCYKNSNVYADISGFVYGDFDYQNTVKFERALQEFRDIAGSDKLLFGSDSPISNQKSYIKTLKHIANTAECDNETYTPEYLSQNTKKAFKIC